MGFLQAIWVFAKANGIWIAMILAYPLWIKLGEWIGRLLISARGRAIDAGKQWVMVYYCAVLPMVIAVAIYWTLCVVAYDIALGIQSMSMEIWHQWRLFLQDWRDGYRAAIKRSGEQP